jgi:hypothetical protein
VHLSGNALICASTILERSCCRTHRYVAAPNKQANNLTTDNFVVDKMMPELLELVNTYLPDILWSDGEAGRQLIPARHPLIGGEVVGFLK